MQIGRHGQLQNGWMMMIKRSSCHISHLYELFPSNQISPYRTPQLYGAFRALIQRRCVNRLGWVESELVGKNAG